MRNLIYGSFLVLVITLIGCSNSTTNLVNSNNNTSLPEKPDENGEKPVLDEENEEETDDMEQQEEKKLTLEETASEIVTLLSEKDMGSLSKYIHSTKGVRFTPYGYIHMEEDQVFTANEINKLPADENRYLWGYFDGTGDPIELTFQEYYERFIYDVDYVNAEQVSTNERLGQGNSLDNSAEVYPEGSVVEFHFSGFDPKYEGMDWRSLRLVLEMEEGKWVLVGVIHDEWTI